MGNNPSTFEDKVRSFWHRYVQRVNESDVKPPFDRWMVRRAEEYIAAFPDRRLGVQTPADVERYLSDLGKRTGLKDWQFRQSVDAIRILSDLVGVSWLDAVDWNAWRASARPLEWDHPIVARDYAPVGDDGGSAPISRMGYGGSPPATPA